MCVDLGEEDYREGNNLVKSLTFINKRPTEPGYYYVTRIKNPKDNRRISKILISNKSDIKSEMCTLIFLGRIRIFYTDYKYFCGPFDC